MKREPIAPAERAKILELIDRALQPVEVAKNRFLVEHDASVGDGTLAAIATASTTPLASKEELTALRSLDQQFTNLLERLSQRGRDHVRPELERRQAALAEALSSGTTPTPVNREGLEAEFEAIRIACKASLAKVSEEAAGIIGAIAKRFVIFAKTEVERIAIQDFKEAERFGLPYRPSPIVRSLKAALAHAERLAARPRCGRPRDAAATFNVIL